MRRWNSFTHIIMHMVDGCYEIGEYVKISSNVYVIRESANVQLIKNTLDCTYFLPQ